MKSNFKVGDKVVLVSEGAIYPSYTSMLESMYDQDETFGKTCRDWGLDKEDLIKWYVDSNYMKVWDCMHEEGRILAIKEHEYNSEEDDYDVLHLVLFSKKDSILLVGLGSSIVTPEQFKKKKAYYTDKEESLDGEGNKELWNY